MNWQCIEEKDEVGVVMRRFLDNGDGDRIEYYMARQWRFVLSDRFASIHFIATRMYEEISSLGDLDPEEDYSLGPFCRIYFASHRGPSVSASEIERKGAMHLKLALISIKMLAGLDPPPIEKVTFRDFGLADLSDRLE